MIKYEFSNRAEKDLHNIWIYTQDNWSAQQAEKYIRELETEIKYLCEEPNLGRKITDFPSVRKINYGSHSIIYEKRDHYIFIVRILHQQMNLSKHLKD